MVPEPDTEVRGTVLTVATNSDETNGDTSSAAALVANPGPDGISLREALEATNNDPGTYTIVFAPELAGATIEIGAGPDLPPLTGGSVFITGDVDSDSRPDIRLLNLRPHQPDAFAFGPIISSSGNRLHALILENFSIGVFFQPASVSTTYADNEVSNLILRDIHAEGITQYSDFGVLETHNSWIDTRVLRNTIESSGSGIGFTLGGSVGDVIERLVVAENTVRIAEGGSGGVGVTAGFRRASDANRASDVLIAKNTIEGHPGAGIGVTSGGLGGSTNVVEGLRIRDNRIHIDSQNSPEGYMRMAVGVGTGDGATDYTDPGSPIVYPEDNVVRDVEISGNEFIGESVTIFLSGGCCGAAANSIHGVRIEGNTLRGTARGEGVLGIGLVGAGNGGYFSRPSFGNEIFDVSVRDNSITLATEVAPNDFAPGSGVLLAGAFGAHQGSVRDVEISENCIDTQLVGVNVVGGFGDPQMAAVDNAVTDVAVQNNLILRPPSLVTPAFPGVKGINLTGGVQSATGNRVACVVLAGNSVAGIPDDLSTSANFGQGAAGNEATTGGC